MKGEIEIEILNKVITQKISVTPHVGDEFKTADDYCDAGGHRSPTSVCKKVAHLNQNRFIAINIDGFANNGEVAEGESEKHDVKDPDAGHAHGGGSN